MPSRVLLKDDQIATSQIHGLESQGVSYEEIIQTRTFMQEGTASEADLAAHAELVASATVLGHVKIDETTIKQNDDQQIEVADGSISDVKLGDRTIDDTLATPASIGPLTSLFSWIAGRLKAISGKSSWLTAPATTLEAANTHYTVKASDTTLGHVKVDGSTITIDSDGIISAGAIDTSNLAYMRTADGSVPSGNTIANTTTETSFSTISAFSAGTVTTGDVIRVRLFGVYSTALSTPSLTLKIKFGGTTLVSTGAVNLVSSASNLGWSLEGSFIVQVGGGSGSVEAQGLLHLDTTGSGITKHTPNTAPISIATNVDANLTVTAQWSASSTSNSITMRQMLVELIKL